METCGKCGVPTIISSGLRWGPNGVISLADSPGNRMVFFECENIDPMFEGVEQLIGVPIERMVIESRARETKRFIERAFPLPEEIRRVLAGLGQDSEGTAGGAPEMKDLVLRSIRVATESIIDVASAYGYGHQAPSELWDTGGDFPWRVQLVTDPYSLMFICADNQGSVEATEGTSMGVRYERVGENRYRIEVFPEEHPLELKERLKRKRYEFKPGEIAWERCEECGVPLEVAARRWDLDRGTITEPSTGRRFAIFGPAAADAIFDDLESELGDEIPAAVVEAQRRYIRGAWSGDEWKREGATFQRMLAARGLGNLVEFEGDSSGLSVTVQNACYHLPMVGTMQALVELTYEVESSTCEWQLSDDGDLRITVRVRAVEAS